LPEMFACPNDLDSYASGSLSSLQGA
jgi:hypothetical protein